MIQSVIFPKPNTGPRLSLNSDELQFFDIFGFIVLKQFFSENEVEKINEELEKAKAITFADLPFDPTIPSSERLQTIQLSNSYSPFIFTLSEDERVYGIAKQLFGEDLIGHQCHASSFVGDTRWHPDHPPINPYPDHRYGIKFGFYTDTLTADTGALRIIPRSHRQPYYGDLKKMPGISNPENIDAFPGFACESNPGDVVLFNLNCWHASRGGKAGRTMLEIVYYAYPKSTDHIEQMRGQVKWSKQLVNTRTDDKNAKPDYRKEWFLNNENSPLRASWIERQRELGIAD